MSSHQYRSIEQANAIYTYIVIDFATNLINYYYALLYNKSVTKKEKFKNIV